MENFILKLRLDHPDLTFTEGKLLCWSPEQKQIFYDPKAGPEGICGVLHEIGHARLQHGTYASDVDLLQKEASAWEEALKLAKNYAIPLDSDHIQDCLDSYRDWLHKRSTCPMCHTKGVQQSERVYICMNCQTTWEVTRSRFCRPYRRQK